MAATARMSLKASLRDRSGSYERYLQEIGTYERISPEREVELSATIRANTDTENVEDAVNELIQSNLRLVVSCLNEFAVILVRPSCPLTRTDLVGEGNMPVGAALVRRGT
jgi:DNA-directed RNA polymerase sigma subunit (sigma70/sigma32)